MLRNYIKIAWRNLIRNKSYSLINTIGLSVGIASCLLIFLFIQDELSYDKYHEKSDRIYRVYKKYDSKEYSGQTLYTSKLLAPTLKREIPGIVSSLRINERWPEILVKYESLTFQEENFFFVDPNIFEVFDFELTKGNPQTVLSRPFTVILSQEMAQKYFGDSNPIGKSLSIQGLWGADEYEVTGVMENTPHNSHFKVNFLTSTETLRIKTPGSEKSFNSWNYSGGYTYILLEEGMAPEKLEDGLHKFLSRHQGEEEASTLSYKLQPLTDIHLYSNFEREIEPNSDIRYIYIFGSIALLILLLAGINYINLATARSADRAVEVGIRKTLGVWKQKLVIQFLCESLVFCLMALFFSFLIVEAFLPYFNDVTGKALSLELLDPNLIFIAFGLLLLIGIVAGAYPAFVLSRFKPKHIFSGIGSGRSKSKLRNSLVVFQFALSIALIVGTIVIDNQMDHVREKRLGFDEENVVSILTGNEFRKAYPTFKDKLLSHTNIQSVTSVSPILPSTSPQRFALEPEGNKARNVNYIFVSKDFIKTLDIPLKEGQDVSDLSTQFEEDSTGKKYVPVLINEAGVKEWSWKNPLGKTFNRFNPIPRVVGVVKDFHYRSLKEEIAPLVIFPLGGVQNVLVRVNSTNLPHTISFIRDTWSDIGPGTPLEYSFLDDRFNSLYQAEDRMASLFSSFTILAIFIACLGLLGLTAYSAERRIKEIGIRKVLGATIADIITLLSKDFLKLVLLGFLIAIPIAWYAMNQWLADFAYKIEIGPGIFLLAGTVALVIALATVSWQSIRAALANPVDSLRSE